MESSEEWTFVPIKSKKSSGSNSKNKKREQQLSKAKNLQKSLQSNADEDNKNFTEVQKINLIKTTEKCIIELKESLGSSDESKDNEISFFSALLDGIIDKTFNGESHRCINEIVCYGIGNFYTARMDKYNPSLIQLACIIALRDELTERYSEKLESSSKCEKQLSASSSNSISLVYFEPFIVPIEREVLLHFNVKIIDKNEQGKRKINADNRNSKNVKDCTLFYMPHCPMRLYSNVLWANWSEELMFNRILLLGNSFKAYDDRIVASSRKLGDKTNAIFPLLPFIHEQSILLKQTSKKQNEISNDDLEKAFNDCVVISFQNDKGKPFPPQPEEYIIQETTTEEIFV
ncbi:hypothetical protein CTEN210_11381 [Chaetoceros tenuissimus]|uniref:SRR1-like domain-containing protein n=1 Tax=Chaetoceros tenuissimus TaxID=426638 RepID=A0AAD3H930_9STRA|nr:hypothetical protein CTEN210_11381 [Chaetoceros tenuissimus]